MAYGSKRWFPYTTDAGEVFGINRDESNIEMFNTGADALTLPTGARGIPKELRTRKVVAKAADGSTKTVDILTRDLFDAIIKGQAFAAPAIGEENLPLTSFVVQSKKPERDFNSPIGLDTGKNDGDQP